MDCDLTKITYFFVNEIEGEMLTGEKDPQKIMAGVLAKYPMSRLILTLGSDGAWYADKDGRCYQEICKVKAVDTTAAGDTFSGYFLASVLGGKTPAQALKTATRRIRDCCIEKGSSAVDPDGRRSCTEVRGDGIAVISGACLCSCFIMPERWLLLSREICAIRFAACP